MDNESGFNFDINIIFTGICEYVRVCVCVSLKKYPLSSCNERNIAQFIIQKYEFDDLNSFIELFYSFFNKLFK